jgi:hypothetical protein
MASHRCLGLGYGMAQGIALLPFGAALAIGHGHIHQFLGIGLEAAIEPLGQGAPLGLDQHGHLQGRE